MQDTFRVACEREDKLFASDNPEGWLMNVLKNVSEAPGGSGARLAETVLEVMDENGGAADVELDLDTLYGDLSGSEDFRLLEADRPGPVHYPGGRGGVGIPWRPARSGLQRPGSGSRSGCGRTLSRDGGFLDIYLIETAKGV